jgi:hypothetical protein
VHGQVDQRRVAPGLQHRGVHGRQRGLLRLLHAEIHAERGLPQGRRIWYVHCNAKIILIIRLLQTDAAAALQTDATAALQTDMLNPCLLLLVTNCYNAITPATGSLPACLRIHLRVRYYCLRIRRRTHHKCRAREVPPHLRYRELQYLPQQDPGPDEEQDRGSEGGRAGVQA